MKPNCNYWRLMTMSKFEATIEHITNLPILEKLRLWNYYMVDTYRLKHHAWYKIDPSVIFFQEGYNCNMANAAKGLEEIDTRLHYNYNNSPKATETHYLWVNENPISFEDWVDPVKNKRVIDNGEDWDKNGCGQRIRTDYFGIYDYYIKFVLN